MKAISIREPWASMFLENKSIETRTWKTDYRGNLLLCASKYPKSEISGKAFAIANLIDVRPMVREDVVKACCEMYDGAYSWVFGKIEKIQPFPVKGQLGLFNINYSGDLKMKQFIAEKDLKYLANIGSIAQNKYTVTVETMVSKYDKNVKPKILEKSEFDDKKEANKYKKELIKKYDLVNHGGYIVNYKDSVELTTNY
jgi:hypothetical protein